MSNFLTVVELFLVINQCAPDVHPRTMAAIVEAESSRNIYAINVNSSTQVKPPTNLEEAKEAFKALKDRGSNFDVGLSQINSANFTHYGITEDNAFDPCTNIKVAGDILKNNFINASKNIVDEQEALMAALSFYNTGNYSRGMKNGYVNNVVDKSSKIIVPEINPLSKSETTEKKDDVIISKEVKKNTNWNVFSSSNSKNDANVFEHKNKEPMVFIK